MTAREKILDVEQQVRSMIAAGGVIAAFKCPFCGSESTAENEILCCPEAAEVVNAVIDHIEHIGRCDVVNNVLDRFAALQNRSVLLN